MTDAKQREMDDAESQAMEVGKTASSVVATLKADLAALEECLEKSKACLQRAIWRAVDSETVIKLLRHQTHRFREQLDVVRRTP